MFGHKSCFTFVNTTIQFELYLKTHLQPTRLEAVDVETMVHVLVLTKVASSFAMAACDSGNFEAMVKEDGSCGTIIGERKQ